MMGLDIAYYCPVCDDMKHTVTGATRYMKVNGKSLINLRCKDCGTELFVEVIDGHNFVEKGIRSNIEVRDNTTDGFTKIINEIFESGIYTEKDSEEYIMSDVINKLTEKTSVIGVSRHMLGIQKYIELKMCTMFNNPLERLKTYVVDNGIDKLPMVDRKYIYKKEDAEFDCTLFY